MPSTTTEDRIIATLNGNAELHHDQYGYWTSCNAEGCGWVSERHHLTPDGAKHVARRHLDLVDDPVEWVDTEEPGGPNYSWTHMRESAAEDWPTPEGAKFRRVGWLDQQGRAWDAVPSTSIAAALRCGSFTPLLIQLDDD